MKKVSKPEENRQRTDNVNCVRILATRNSNQEVVGLDIPVNKRLLMDCLHTGDL